MNINFTSTTKSRCEISTLKFESLISFLENLIISEKSVFLIADSNLAKFKEYKELFKGKTIFFFDACEDNKNLENVTKIYEFLLKNRADRKSFVVGIGGGITLDVAGFVSTTYMRGLRFGFIPTTLLSMVDASIGGKNGVNFKGFKNYIGTFNHPDFIAISPNFLSTLSEREYNIGMAEIIKYGAIANSDLLDYLLLNADKIKEKDEDTINYLIEESVKIKVDIVRKDFKEAGLRKILNFGHTLGHALERLKKVNHGEGVAAGMVFAGWLSVRKGYLKEDEFERLKKVISAFNLPLFIKDVSLLEIIEGIAGDKKKEGDKIDFVLLKGLGVPIIEAMGLGEIKNELENMRKHC